MGTSVLRGINDEKTRQVVSRAIEGGWEMEERNGHGFLSWPPTRTKITFSCTPSDHRAVLNLANRIRQVSGVDCLDHHNHRKSRKKDVQTDFTMERCNFERAMTEAKNERLDRLKVEHSDLIEEFRSLYRPGANRTIIDRARKVLRQIISVEKALENMHYPYTPFDSGL